MPSEAQAVVEMHCHTVFSPDGYRTPEELVERAAERKVAYFSITDHNHLGAQERAIKHAEKFSLPYVTGLEIDSRVDDERSYHFLCFGFDPGHTGLKEVASVIGDSYALGFQQLLPYFKDFGLDIPWEEWEALLPKCYPTHPHPTLNQWFARDIAIEKKCVPDAAAFSKILQQIKGHLKKNRLLKTWKPVNFEKVRDTVHAAGGKILLAHVGRYYPEDMDQQLATIQALLSNGMDGFELNYPDHLQMPAFHRLRDFAKNTDCFLSAGSDTHDAFASTKRNAYFGKITVEDWVKERLVKG